MSEEEVLGVVRWAWHTAVGKRECDAVFEYLLESITADVVQDGPPESVEEAEERFRQLLLDSEKVGGLRRQSLSAAHCALLGRDGLKQSRHS